MTMTSEHQQVDAVDAFTAAARNLSAGADDVAQPSSTYDMLAALAAAQLEQAVIYQKLAAWHSQAQLGVDYDGEDERSDPEAPALPEVVRLLSEAAEEARLTANYLRHAQTANGIIVWRDEPPA